MFASTSDCTTNGLCANGPSHSDGARLPPVCQGGSGAAAGFEAAGERLDVLSANREEAKVVLVAPGDELVPVERVARQAS
jgi:hypothetical protein